MESKNKWFFWVIAANAILALTTTGARASQDTRATVHGKVALELRHTAVPQYCTVDGGCPKSKPYWVLVLRDGAGTYELDQVFDLGNDRQPPFVALDKILVRPGSELTVQAEVERVAPDYYYMSDVTNVSQIEAELNVGKAPLYYGWSCRSVDTDTDAQHLQISADIWFAAQNLGANGYTIRVSASITGEHGRTTYQLARIDQASAGLEGTDLVYQGSARQGGAEMMIFNQGNQFHNAPSVLDLKRTVASPLAVIPLDSMIHMVCNPTRG